MKVNQFTKKNRRIVRNKTQSRSASDGGASDDSSDNRSRYQNNGSGKNYQQQVDKYLNLAKDHLSSGDRVMAEYNYQYADHYIRLMNERNEQRAQRQHTAKENFAPSDGEVVSIPTFQQGAVSSQSLAE